MLVNQHMTITITFNGLLVFAFNNGEKPLYEIGVLKVSDPPHLLRINRLTTDPAGHTQIFPEIADKIQSGDLYLEVPERNGREGVSRYSGNAQATDEDPQDFDLLIDLEKREPGDPALNLKPGFPSQSIFVNQGVFYTYQPARVLLKSPNGRRRIPRLLTWSDVTFN